MSATAVKGFILDITKQNVKAVQQRLVKDKEKPTQRYSDPTSHGASYTLLHKAVDVGNEAIVLSLIKAGADVNAVDEKGGTPLHWLAQHSDEAHAKLAEALIKAKANIRAQDASKASPAHAAAAQGNTALLQLLIAAGGPAIATDTAPGHSPLHAACKKGSLATMQLLLASGAAEQLGLADSRGYTPLMRLVAGGFGAEAKFLLDYAATAPGAAAATAAGGSGPASTSAPGEALALHAKEAAGGKTALLLACGRPEPDVALVKLLLDTGADADVQDRANGDTALLVALKAGDGALAKLLLGHVRHIDMANAAGESALGLAMGFKDTSVLDGVLQRGPELGGSGPRLVTKARAEKRDSTCAHAVRLLSDSDLNNLNLDFKTLLEEGMPLTAVAYLAQITPGGAEALRQPLASDPMGGTRLHQAVAEGGSYGLVMGLLLLGLNVNQDNKDGDTALHIAARAGHVEVCRALVEGGADVMRRNGKNRTPKGQIKIPEGIKAYLDEAEEAAKARKLAQQAELWDDKMRATQTQSACCIQAL